MMIYCFENFTVHQLSPLFHLVFSLFFYLSLGVCTHQCGCEDSSRMIISACWHSVLSELQLDQSRSLLLCLCSVWNLWRSWRLLVVTSVKMAKETFHLSSLPLSTMSPLFVPWKAWAWGRWLTFLPHLNVLSLWLQTRANTACLSFSFLSVISPSEETLLVPWTCSCVWMRLLPLSHTWLPGWETAEWRKQAVEQKVSSRNVNTHRDLSLLLVSNHRSFIC